LKVWLDDVRAILEKALDTLVPHHGRYAG